MTFLRLSEPFEPGFGVEDWSEEARGPAAACLADARASPDYS